MGLSQPFMAASGDIEPHALTVLIPKRDYGRLLLKSKLEIGGLLILLIFFGGSAVCFTRAVTSGPFWRISTTSLQSAVRRETLSSKNFCPLSDKLRDHERTITDLETERQDLRGQMEQAEADAKRLAQRRKSEIDPEEYQLFLSAYQKLGTGSPDCDRCNG